MVLEDFILWAAAVLGLATGLSQHSVIAGCDVNMLCTFGIL